MIYRPRPPKKGFFSYIMPFLLIVLIFVGGVYSFKKMFFSSDSETSQGSFFSDAYAMLETQKGTTEIMLSGAGEWKVSPEKMKLFKGDAVKTFKDNAKLTLPNDIILNLDKNSSLLIDKIESDNSFRDISITLVSGRLWLGVQRMINPKSKVSLNFQNMSLVTKGGTFSIELNAIRAISGDANIDILDGEKKIGTTNIGIGQEIILTESSISDAKLGKLPEVLAISDEFKLSPWYKENYFGIIDRGSNSESNAIKQVDILSGQTISGSGASGAIIGSSSGSLESATGTITEEIVKKVFTGELTIDDPKTNPVELKKDEMYAITGKTSKNIAIVKVNGYRLGKYRLGHTNFQYNTMIDWGNLVEGENVIKVEAYDKENDKVLKKETKINVKIVKDEPKKEETKKENASTGTSVGESKSKIQEELEKDPVPTAVLQITSPKEGEIINSDVVEVKGVAPDGTVSVYVGKYKLSKFKEGDKDFVYRAAIQWGNLKSGMKNTFFIKALDSDGNIIESVNLSFFVEKQNEGE